MPQRPDGSAMSMHPLQSGAALDVPKDNTNPDPEMN